MNGFTFYLYIIIYKVIPKVERDVDEDDRQNTYYRIRILNYHSPRQQMYIHPRTQWQTSVTITSGGRFHARNNE